MAPQRIGRRGLAGLALAGLGGGSAAAHHGWSWAEGEQTTLRGTIREVHIGPPHPTLRVEAADGTWTVELGNPRLTAASGFSAEAARAGDTVVALGNRSRNPNERRLKAVRLTVRDRTYDIYPDRIGRS
ncbi:DUF6152 family protein [Falsiroseomonas oryzae]|uniref:DUF6152 family protein n=1 Tax=Falsiroseomonas oryzae TaxID=2766473 RepID=UPI0022EA9880|nr:DUF6152 family protein [Roseomonas sp. MO-31]